MDLIEEIFKNTKSIAVIGMKDDRSDAYTVPEYLFKNGYVIYPVNPTREGKEALGKKFYKRVDEITDEIDLVEIFRRPEFIPGHVKEILNMNPLPKYVWFQLGIENDASAEALEKEGIRVVQNACMLVEHRHLKYKL